VSLLKTFIFASFVVGIYWGWCWLFGVDVEVGGVALVIGLNALHRTFYVCEARP
jgi:hypothetical protein